MTRRRVSSPRSFSISTAERTSSATGAAVLSICVGTQVFYTGLREASAGEANRDFHGVGRIGRARIVHDDVATVHRVADAGADGAGADVDDDRARPGGVRSQDRGVSKAAARRTRRRDVHMRALEDVDDLAGRITTPSNGDCLIVVEARGGG